jgi:hypothetical protein
MQSFTQEKDPEKHYSCPVRSHLFHGSKIKKKWRSAITAPRHHNEY